MVTEFIVYPKQRAAEDPTAKLDSRPTDAPFQGLRTSIITYDRFSSIPTSAEEVKSSYLRQSAPRTDGGIVCCLVVSECCFKMGRRTVPPVSETTLLQKA
jgi:hypothetical protein